MAEYRYGMRVRGFSIGCQPKDGFIRREDSNDRRYYDIIVYDRQLTEKEIDDYSLDRLGDDPLPDELARLCEETETNQQGIATLMRYYTHSCGWTEEEAIEHIKGLFAKGVIVEIKNLGSGSEN